MKFLFLLAAAAFPSAVWGDHHSNLMECVDSSAAGTGLGGDTSNNNNGGGVAVTPRHGNADDHSHDDDLFPHKVTPEYSESWDIEYYSTYKILTNKAVNASYLLYQCGTEVPANVDTSKFDNVIPVPLQHGINIATTPMITFLEMLGLRTQIKGFLSYSEFVGSPCMIKLLNDGTIASSTNTNNATILDTAGIDVEDALTLTGQFFSSDVLLNTLPISEATESSFAGTMEWIKVFATLFNQEELANEIFNAAICRFNEISTNVASVSADMTSKPTVLWAYYSDYCGGWSVAECPNYYCEFATACQAQMLNTTEGDFTGSIETSGCPPVMTNEEFATFGKTAEKWIYPSGNWNNIYGQNEEFLSQFVSVQNQTVFDYQGSGENNWFEQRYAEYGMLYKCILFFVIVFVYLCVPAMSLLTIFAMLLLYFQPCWLHS